MRMLQNDPNGTAKWIEREAMGMDPMQLFREFVQNGTEAGASKVVIDGYRDPATGRLLARITDNGSGMTERQLIERLSTIHGQFKGADNYGVGARIASLPANPAGLTFASRTADSEAMVTIIKDRGSYGIKNWKVEDVDGVLMSAEAVAPDDGMLSRLAKDETGTVVILHGDGKSDTWTTSVSYQVHKFLARRYYDFGGDVTVHVDPIGSGLKEVVPMGGYFSDVADADGEVPFKDIAGLDGVMFWWTIPTTDEASKDKRQAAVVPGGIGMVIDNEVFDYGRTYMSEFGILYKSVQSRVAVLVFVDGATMDTGRGGVILPGGHRRNVPWKKLGAHFTQNLPPEIDVLLKKVMPSGNSLDVELAKMLDDEWFKNLEPVSVHVPVTDSDQDGSGEGEGNTVTDPSEPGPSPEPKPTPNPGPKPRPVNRKNDGDKPTKDLNKHVPPKVEFVDAEQFVWENASFGVQYVQASNLIEVAKNCPPYVREVQRWKERTNHSESIIEAAVQAAYAVELGATVIDAGKMVRDPLLDANSIDQLRSGAVLFGKMLGMQAITQTIEARIKELLRSA